MVTAFLHSWGGVRLSPLGAQATSGSIVQAPEEHGDDDDNDDDDDDDEDDDDVDQYAVGGMRIGKGNRNTW
jgi:hypothetical protein